MPKLEEDADKVVKDPTVIELYIDSTSMRATLYSCELTMGRQIGKLIRPKVRLILSPQHAKDVAQLLSQFVDLYEDQMGPIPFLKSLPVEVEITGKKYN